MAVAESAIHTLPDGRRQLRIAPTLWPKQWRAMQVLGLIPGGPCDGGPYVEQLLYGGAAGGGKSRALREIAYAICFLWPGAEVRLARRTYPELEEYIIPKCLDELPKEVATYNSTQHEFKFVNGSRLRFLHAQRDEDVQQYKTAEWAALLIDQAEDFTEYQLRFLSHRVRQPRDAFGGKWHRTIVFSANPGGVAHGYLKAQFVDLAREKVYESPESEGAYRRYFLPAFLKDNPSLDPDEYRRTLSGLPEHLVKAYLTGDWSVVLGAYFSQFSSRDLNGEKWHVWSLAEAKAHYGIGEDDPFPPPDWLRWAGIDGGINDPWCVEWLTRAPNRRVFVYRETYGRGIQIPDQARTIKRIAAENGERITRLLADPAMFANRANLSVSDFQIYAAEGVPLTRGNNKREQGWRRVGELLDRKLDDGYPALVLIDGAAPQLQRTLPLLLIDELRREDVSQVHGRMDPASENSVRDDPGDSLRYAITPTALPDPTRQGTPLDTRYPIGTFGESNFDRDQLNQTGMTSSF